MDNATEAEATQTCPVCGAKPGKVCFTDDLRPVIHAERLYLIERMSAVDRLSLVASRP